MCGRFVRLMDDVLGLSTGEMANKLGYTTTATIAKVRRMETFPDMERLKQLATIKTEDGSWPNIHWLITGEGTPLVLGKEKGARRVRALAEQLIQDFNLDEARVGALRCLLEGAPIQKGASRRTG